MKIRNITPQESPQPLKQQFLLLFIVKIVYAYGS